MFRLRSFFANNRAARTRDFLQAIFDVGSPLATANRIAVPRRACLDYICRNILVWKIDSNRVRFRNNRRVVRRIRGNGYEGVADTRRHNGN